MFAHFACGGDGTVYLPLLEHAGAVNDFSRVSLVALLPSGEVQRFVPQAVPGYRQLVLLGKFFVSETSIYALAMADRIDPSDSRNVTARAYLIQVFDLSGQLKTTLILDPDVIPTDLMAFRSGEVVVMTADKLNYRTRLLLLDPSGHTDSEWKMFDHDLTGQLKQTGKDDSAYSADADGLERLMAGAQFVPYGDDLLMATYCTTLPLLEITPRGTITALPLVLPAGMSQVALLPSDDGLLHVAAGSYASGVAPTPADQPGAGYRPFTTSGRSTSSPLRMVPCCVGTRS